MLHHRYVFTGENLKQIFSILSFYHAFIKIGYAKKPAVSKVAHFSSLNNEDLDSTAAYYCLLLIFLVMCLIVYNENSSESL